MNAYVIVSEGEPWENIIWSPEGKDFHDLVRSSLFWVEGNNDQELIQTAKGRFSNIFKIQSAEITAIDGIKGVNLYIAKPDSHEPMPTEIKLSDGTVLRRVKAEVPPETVIH